MSQSTLSFRHRLIGKITLYGVGPTLLVVALGVGINAHRTQVAAEGELDRAIQDAARVTAAELDRELREPAATAKVVAHAQLEGGLLDDTAATLRLLEALALSDGTIETIAVIRERTADREVPVEAPLGTVGPADQTPNPALRTASGGSPSFAVLRAHRTRSSASPEQTHRVVTDVVAIEADPSLTSLAMDARRHSEREGRAVPFWLFTSSDASSGLIRHAWPLMQADRFVGMVLVERRAVALNNILTSAAERLQGDLFLADRERIVAASGDEGLRNTLITGSPLERFLRSNVDNPGSVRALGSGERGDGDTHHYAATSLRSNGWLVLVRKPSDIITEQVTGTLMANIVTAIGGVVLIGGVLLALARGFGRRLERAVLAATRIADGNLSEPVPSPETVDESGLLLGAFEQMASNLNHIVGQVRHASIQINSTATELAASSRELESNASGFGASATEVAAATRQISTTGEELLNTMQAVADSAAGAAEKAQDSRNGLQSMQKSVRRLDEAAHTVAARLSAINDKAKNINAIVGTITKVADETNLLSVNAAIEAEKAGEFGLGFLIVAREIRRLADQTASATVDIERMIRQMQSAVSAGVSEMDRFGESLRAVLEDVDRVGNRVQGIIAHVEDDTIRFVQVTEGMRSQAAGAKQIDGAMRELTFGAQQTIQSAGEFGSAANELERAIASLKVTVSSMRLRSSDVSEHAVAGDR
jgi:methyl-accepting chemotaxis protein